MNEPDRWSDLSRAVALRRDTGRYAEARELVSAWLARQPGCADAHGLLAEILLLEKREEAANASLAAGLVLDPSSPTIQRARARAELRQGRPDAALVSARRAHAADPSDPESGVVLGSALAACDHLGEAGSLLERVITQAPATAGAYQTRALLRLRAGDAKGAITDAERAAALRPHLAAGWRLLASIRFKSGDVTGAVDALTQALEREPHEAEHLIAMAELKRALGDEGAAQAWIAKAGALWVDAPDVGQLNLQAAALAKRGRHAEALQTVIRSMRLKDTADGRQVFVQCIKVWRPSGPDPEIRDLLLRALAEPWARPALLVRTGLALVAQNPAIARGLKRAADAWPRRPGADELFGSDGVSALAGDSLLMEILSSAPVTAVEFEIFLTCARGALLSEGLGLSDDHAIGLQAALAAQCFVNEYVWGRTETEEVRAGDLRRRLVEALEAGPAPSASEVLAVAAYYPLYSLPNAERLLAQSWPGPVDAVLTQQVREPLRERRLAEELRTMSPIRDAVSLKVRAQYEANPYPRWVKLPCSRARASLSRAVASRFPNATFSPGSNAGFTEVLVAGCGTGQYAIELAQGIADARILAVDLSLASLAYARRKTEELGLDCIEYAQADILEMGGGGRTFDLIDCTGVLHHLAEPIAGAKALASRLRPGGVMSLALYSALARRELDPATAMASGHGAEAADVRVLRQAVVGTPPGHPARAVMASDDFFSTSTCRDLLFHVQEHRLSMSQVGELLKAAGLSLLGFEVNAETRAAYQREFPEDPAAVDLERWAAFEARRPRTFAGMYVFWAQMPAD